MKKLASYETIMILSVKNGEEATAALIAKFNKLIADNATIDSVDDWGKRRLAYEIKKEADGHYVLVNFTSAPDFCAELDRVYRITEGLLRSIIIAKV